MRFDLRNLRFDNRRRVPLYNIYGLTLYEQLLAEGTMLGRDLTVTNTRTGARKSIDSATIAEVAANTPDQFVLNNRLYCFGAMNGATNLVSSVLTDWTKTLDALTATDIGGGVYRLTKTGIGAGYVSYDFASSTSDRIAKMQMRLVSGVFPDNDDSIVGFTTTGGGSFASPVFRFYNLTSEWLDVELPVTAPQESGSILFRSVTPAQTGVIEVRFVRAIDSAVAHAAFPDGSVAGATYNGDLLTFNPTLGSVGTIITGVYAYGWNGLLQNNPGADTNPRILWDSGSPVSTSWMGANGQTFDWSGNGGSIKAESTTDVSGTAFQILRLDWNGTVYGLQLDGEAKQTVAETGQPVGPIALGNRISVGDDEAHAAMIAPIIFNRILSDTEHAAILAGVQADCATYGGNR